MADLVARSCWRRGRRRDGSIYLAFYGSRREGGGGGGGGRPGGGLAGAVDAFQPAGEIGRWHGWAALAQEGVEHAPERGERSGGGGGGEIEGRGNKKLGLRSLHES